MNLNLTQPLSRRTALRSAGAMIALPLLEAMGPSLAFGAPSRFRPLATSHGAQPRLICCYVPQGVSEPYWYPENTGANWTLSPTLQALEPFKADFSLISGLMHPRSLGGHEGADTWLTGAHLRGTPGKDYQNSISADQLLAKHHGEETRFPSVELSDMNGTGGARHTHTLAFDQFGVPLPAENSPNRVFERLFAAEQASSRAATLQRHAEQRSILDEVLGETRELHSRLGHSDQQKLDEYLTSVRETERRVRRLEGWVDVPKPEVDGSELQLQAAPSNGHDRPMWLDVMLELSYLAFQTDLTRVITFEWSREAGGSGGQRENHHELSHHGGDPEMLKRLAAVDTFHISKLVHLLGLLKATAEEGGTMLDNTLVLYGSGMSNGKGGGHSPRNLPLIVAGGQNLGLRLGQHLKFENDSPPMSNLLLTLLQRAGLDSDSFSDSTGTLSGLT